MTKAKAATVVAALVTNGNFARAAQLSDGTWVVYASSPSGQITVDTVKAFQDAQGITANVNDAIFT